MASGQARFGECLEHDPLLCFHGSRVGRIRQPLSGGAYGLSSKYDIDPVEQEFRFGARKFADTLGEEIAVQSEDL